jgi:lysophospholipase L1-like esterase
MRNYAYMDDWSDEEVTRFKEEGIDQQETHLKKGVSSDALFQRVNLVAEGDSWFDYPPGTDLIDCLRNNHGYSIKNYASAGDTLENMVYGTRIKTNFQAAEPTIVQVLRKISEIKPKVFLFSGGGNDIAGEEFSSYLNHSETGLPTLRLDYIDYMIQTVFKKCFEDLIKKVKAASPGTKIVTHGYGHTLPTGKGVSLLGVKFAGPWLKPSLSKKRISSATEQKNSVRHMIDTFNKMLIDLDNAHANFHHVDLRPHINAETDWTNELHLKNSAYAKAAFLIANKIKEIC